MNKILALLLLISIVTVVKAQGEAILEQTYEIKDDVMILTEQNIEKAIAQFPLIIVKFFAPWCGACQRIAPTWIEVAKTMDAADRVGN